MIALGLLLGGCKHSFDETVQKQYAIAFDSHGGSAVETITTKEGTAVARPTDPVKEGYTFLGWFSDAADGALYTWPHTVTADLTMHGQWTPLMYTIGYELNGGSNAPENPGEYTIESSALILAAPSRTGYGFGGWYDNPDFSGEALTGIPPGSTGDKTFYAKWIPGVSIHIALKPVTEDPPLSGVSLFEDEGNQFSTGTGYVSWTWYWNGTVINGENSNAYTLAAHSNPPGIYELSVLVTTRDGEKLSARCRVTIKAK